MIPKYYLNCSLLSEGKGCVCRSKTPLLMYKQGQIQFITAPNNCLKHAFYMRVAY